MKINRRVILRLLVVFATLINMRVEIAAADTLRAVYLSGNPAQATQDPQTGKIRGASYSLAEALAERLGKTLDFKSIGGPPSVIEAVKNGDADIGFVAYEPTRLGAVEFSQPYMLVQQSFLVLDGSNIRNVADIDRPSQRIAGTPGDSITLCLKRTLKRAAAMDIENNPVAIAKALINHDIDAIGANRQRLTTLMQSTPGSRLLPDNLFNVPQNIVVTKGDYQTLATVNKFIDDMRSSGFLEEAIKLGGAIGVVPAHPGSQLGCQN